MTERSNRREVRNPILGLPIVREAIAEMSPEEAARWARILLAIQADARDRAQENWRRHKAPMAAYWKAIGAITGHIAKAIRFEQQRELEL